MATNRRRRNRFRQAVNGLSEAAYHFFGDGPIFDGEVFEKRTTEAERDDLWREHRKDIIARWHDEHPQHSDLHTWGETVEGMKGAGIGNQ